jgi:hypothetical protein
MSEAALQGAMGAQIPPNLILVVLTQIVGPAATRSHLGLLMSIITLPK